MKNMAVGVLATTFCGLIACSSAPDASPGQSASGLAPTFDQSTSPLLHKQDLQAKVGICKLSCEGKAPTHTTATYAQASWAWLQQVRWTSAVHAVCPAEPHACTSGSCAC
jgi:hypothetical protein